MKELIFPKIKITTLYKQSIFLKSQMETENLKSLISINILQTINLVCWLGYKLGTVPFTWDDRQMRLEFTTSRIKLIQCYIIVIYSLCNTLFMIVRVIQSIYSLHTPYGIIILNLLTTVTWSASSAFQINTLLFRTDIQEFFNQFMNTRAIIQSKSIYLFLDLKLVIVIIYRAFSNAD